MAAALSNSISIGGGGLGFVPAGFGSTSTSSKSATVSLLKPLHHHQINLNLKFQYRFPPHPLHFHQFQYQYPSPSFLLYSNSTAPPNPSFRRPLCCSTSHSHSDSDSNSFPFNFNLKDLFGYLTSNIVAICTLLWEIGRDMAYIASVHYRERRFFTLRIVLRVGDDDHEVERRLSELVESYKDWDRSSTFTSAVYGRPPHAKFILHESVDCLLENAHLWVCGASQVSLTYKQLYKKVSALFEEEPFELLTSERREDQIDCVEFTLHLCVMDAMSDGYIHNHADLAVLLQQLQTIYKGHVVSAIPECKSIRVDREKLDQVQGYSHSTIRL